MKKRIAATVLTVLALTACGSEATSEEMFVSEARTIWAENGMPVEKQAGDEDVVMIGWVSCRMVEEEGYSMVAAMTSEKKAAYEVFKSAIRNLCPDKEEK